ncbi:FecR family protein [Paraflavitalea speifideaquila]|uniref:FecR family protein n=1 Tax=Paraflavitalea speifideaquila TaxID=3076558 RepID=UPI0028E9E6B8|nr:FecR family protein [Paraflavitalea speifideiaquila]
MEITKQQISLFLANKLPAAEAQQVADLLTAHPHLLDEFFSEAEWESFETHEQVPAHINQEMLAFIKKRQQPGIIRRLTRGWLRVAAALLVVVAGWLLYQQLDHQPLPEKNTPPAQARVIQQEIVLSNTTKKEMSYRLEDGSEIILSKNSTVKYIKPFDAHKRDLHLTGEALFKVAQDKDRPFTVFANGFSTTALGTSFRIKAYTADKMAHVQLYTGRIVVKNLRQANNALYMAPGDQCSFDYTAVSLARVTTSQSPTVTAIPKKHPSLVATGGIEETAESIIFKNTNLITVMNKLSEVYRVRISYDTAAIQNKKFIGTIARESTLEDVLNTITLLNDLQFIKKEEVYFITKKNNSLTKANIGTPQTGDDIVLPKLIK